jgi:hypothetical protein
MPIIANLLLRKQQLIERRLKTHLTADERIDIECQLNQISTALDFLEEFNPSQRR